MKYSKKNIWDFINGKEEKKYNYNFYIEAINISNDRNLYYRCPPEVKNNYLFVLYLIEKFNNNKCFINEIAQNYLSNTKKEDYTYQELTFIMSNIITNHNDKYYSIYKKERDMIYTSKRKFIENFLEEEDYPEEYGLGFIIVLINEKSEIITNYFAKKFIEDIFYKMEGTDIENIIHLNFREKEEFIKYGIERFLLEYINLFDDELSYYLENNTYLLKNIKININRIINNWDNYNNKKYKDKLTIFQNVSNIIIKKHKTSLSSEEIYQYIDEKNSLIPINLSKSKYKKAKTNKDSINIIDYKCIKEISNLADDIFVYNKNINPNNYNSPSKGKILEFKPKNNS